jgi:hypothetical protein
MTTQRVDDLLQRLPEIAKVVNEFKSENVQLRVFDALLDGFDFPVDRGVKNYDARVKAEKEVRVSGDAPKDMESSPGTASHPKGVRGNKKEGAVSLVADLNLRPKGTKTLREFYGEKKPTTNEQSFAVMTYYLEKVLGISGISPNHIYTGFKDLDLRVPARLRTVISNSASRHAWIDTSDKENIKLTIHGENFVEHDLPSSKKE